MTLPARTLVLAFAFLSGCSFAVAQTSTAKEPTSTVSGKVTIKGKPARRVVVAMLLNQRDEGARAFKATTNDEGVYRITNVPVGSYRVTPAAPGFVIVQVSEYQEQGITVVINGAENVEGIDFDLIRGGVITGKITDANGEPLIEQPVSITRDDHRSSYPGFGASTDDRGIYRVFGVRPGRYRVSVGDTNRGRRAQTPQTFYPDTTDAAKATVIEVGEGTEATNINIKVGAAPATYSVTGRVVDSESGAPVANAVVGLSRLIIIDANNMSSSSDGHEARTNAGGEFQLTNVLPGKYEVSIRGDEGFGARLGQGVTFDVVDQDVAGIVVRTAKGASVSGRVVYEGPKNDTWQPLLSRSYVIANVRSQSLRTSGTGFQLNPNGTFKGGGLPPGTLYFGVETRSGPRLILLRTEYNGVAQPNGIAIEGSEQISDIRLVVTISNSSIRGIIKIENGTLPPDARFVVQAGRPDDPEASFRGGTEADARGHFLIEGLAAGTYEVSVIMFAPNMRRRAPQAKQMVTVTDGAATDVLITLDLSQP
jgi:5-hydroxyisourate hydrolase-like protein (transthyretin family)